MAKSKPKKYGLQAGMRADLEYLRAQLKAYQIIAADCLKAAHAVPDNVDFMPPPVELGTDYSDVEIQLRVQKWWQGQVERFSNVYCSTCGDKYHQDRCSTCGCHFNCGRRNGDW